MVQQDGACAHGLQREESRELVDKRIGRHENIAADAERHGHGRHARDAPPELRIGERALIHDQGLLLWPALRLPIEQRRIVAQIGLLTLDCSLFHPIHPDSTPLLSLCSATFQQDCLAHAASTGDGQEP